MSRNQLEFDLHTPKTTDRNFEKGGRSFYFFDFDDNVMVLPTPLFLFNKKTGEEKAYTTHEFALIGPQIGQPGEFLDYELRMDPQTGSFRRFREKKISLWQKFKGVKQPFIEDILKVLTSKHYEWRGPSWPFFWHAVHNGRPLSIITARGHEPKTIENGITELWREGHITQKPNYLSVFPVSHTPTRLKLGDSDTAWHASTLKKIAIERSVEKAFQTFGHSEHHRFGMSDDDPTNLRLIQDAMTGLKQKYPANSFFIIDTHGGRLVKQEVLVDGVSQTEITNPQSQLNLFD